MDVWREQRTQINKITENQAAACEEMRRQPLRFSICILPKSARVRSGNFIPFTKIAEKQKNRIDNPKESGTIHLTFRQML